MGVDYFMAYCNKCGAYIPDGQTKCLACGFDETEERERAAAATATASAGAASTGTRYGFDNEELRRKLEEQRKKQQQQSQAWAEQERERRERQRQREERAREQAEAQRTRSYNTTRQASRTGANKTESKLFAVLSYVSVLSLIPLLFRRDDEYALYHGRQGLALLIYGVVADILGAIPGIGWIFSLFRVVCVFKGMINAANDIKEPLPYIGKFAERFK